MFIEEKLITRLMVRYVKNVPLFELFTLTVQVKLNLKNFLACRILHSEDTLSPFSHNEFLTLASLSDNESPSL